MVKIYLQLFSCFGVIIEICFTKILFSIVICSSFKCMEVRCCLYYEAKQPALCIDTSQVFSVEGQIPVKLDTSAVQIIIQLSDQLLLPVFINFPLQRQQ